MNFQALFFVFCFGASLQIINSENGATSIRAFNSTEESNFIELVLIIDNKVFKSFDSDLQKVYNFSKDIISKVNSLFGSLNIFIALTDVIIWTEQDQIEILPNGELTLKNFLRYRREYLAIDHPNDYAVLLTDQQFIGGGIEKTYQGLMCSYEYSGSVVSYHTKNLNVLATSIAHAIGHNLGMTHDNKDECICPDENCIMSRYISDEGLTHWSSCSVNELKAAFSRGMNSCLKNLPKKLFESPTCGNGFVEDGEECDCGLPDQCTNNCCNPYTCKLTINAVCATGICCDLDTCLPKSADNICRKASSECDIPEYCTGDSEFCPNNLFVEDTQECDNGAAYCYQGSCKSHNSQCQLLWGPTGESSEHCYFWNKNASRHGNCGYNKTTKTYNSCNEEDIMCGMLHCQHSNRQLEFGMESTSILSHSFVKTEGTILPCRSAILDFGLDIVDPGMVPDGAKCGDSKICINQKCVLVK